MGIAELQNTKRKRAAGKACRPQCSLVQRTRLKSLTAASVLLGFQGVSSAFGSEINLSLFAINHDRSRFVTIKCDGDVSRACLCFVTIGSGRVDLASDRS